MKFLSWVRSMFRPKMAVTVTEKHLDRAINDIKYSYESYMCHCVLAQAVKDIEDVQMVTPMLVVTSSGVYRPVGTSRPLTKELVSAFDTHHYDKVRAMLPLQLTFAKQ